MIRFSLEGAALLLLPFAVYAAVVLAGPRLGLGPRAPFSTHALWLACAGVVLVILALVGFGILGERARGTYVPAHMDGGRLVPGQLR